MGPPDTVRGGYRNGHAKPNIDTALPGNLSFSLGFWRCRRFLNEGVCRGVVPVFILPTRRVMGESLSSCQMNPKLEIGNFQKVMVKRFEVR